MIIYIFVFAQIEAMRPLKEEQWPKLISQSLQQISMALLGQDYSIGNDLWA